ncbi:MAG: hypothetical protein AB7L66_05845 [Gemmatimonadales bacterium]
MIGFYLHVLATGVGGRRPLAPLERQVACEAFLEVLVRPRREIMGIGQK